MKTKRIQAAASKKIKVLKKQYETALRGAEKYLGRQFTFAGKWSKQLGLWCRRAGQKVNSVSPPWLRKVGRVVWVPFGFMVLRIKRLLARRPHRSFKLTRRRDYKRSFKIAGYWSFTNTVRVMLWRNKGLFGGIALTYFALAFAFNSFGQQEAYQNLNNVLNEAGGDLFEGQWGAVTGAGLLLLTSVTTGLTPDASSAQTVLGILTVFLAWLATVWALRNVMAGRKVRVRDALYNSGSPIISTILVSLMLIVQLLPLSIALLVYNAALSSEFITGVEAMLAWVAVALLGVVSLYWMVGTFIALVVVTLPGMYPWQAIQTAGDLVIGRRLRVVLRVLWMVAVIIVSWVLIVIPVILFDQWIKGVWPAIGWVPIVPSMILAMSSLTIVFMAAYIYMLYRKVVDDDAKPA